MLNDMIFNTRREGTPGFSGIPLEQIPSIGFNLPGLGFPFPHMGSGQADTSISGGAYIKTISTDEQRKGNGTVLSWGSNADVELPAPDVRVTPPQAAPPLIKIQAPTDSNLGKSLRNVSGSQAGTARTMHTGPRQSPPKSFATRDEAQSLPSAAVPDPAERDLPPPPSESIRSHRDSSVSKSPPIPSIQARLSDHRGDTPISMREALEGVTPTLPPPQPSQPKISTPVNFVTVPSMMRPVMSSSGVAESGHTGYKTALQTLPATPPQKDRVTVNELGTDEHYKPNPWDLVTQRLYSWAVVWEENSFSRAMEEISLNRQVDLPTLRSNLQVGEFALTIFVMMTFKR